MAYRSIYTGKETNILTVVRQIMRFLKRNKKIKFESVRPGDVRRHIANIYLAEDILGFEQKISFEEGMKRTVDWYLKNMGDDKR